MNVRDRWGSLLAAWRRRRIRVGVSIDADRLHACIRQRGQEMDHIRDLASFDPQHDTWPALDAALRSIAELAGVPGARIDVAVQPPLVDTRRLSLPRLPRRDLLRVLERDAGRYFIGPRGPRIVSAVYAHRGRESPTRVVACALPATLMAAIRHAAGAAGLCLGSVVPAEAVWMAAARAWVRGARRSGTIVVARAAARSIVSWQGGRIVDVRRTARDDLAMPVAACLSVEQAASWAARQAGQCAELELMDAAAAAGRFGRDWRLARRILVAGATACVFIIGITIARTSAELSTLAAQRGQLAASLANAEAIIARHNARTWRLGVIDSLAASGQEWSAVLTDVSALLPADSHVESIRMSGDSVMMVVVGPQPSTVLHALSRPAMVTDVHLASSISTIGDTTASRRFSVTYHLVSGSRSGNQ